MIVANVVSVIGSSLLPVASAMLLIKGILCFSFAVILSTISIEFFTTIPNRARTPMRAGNESGVEETANRIKTPEIERGITSMTIMAFLKEEN